MEIETGIEIKNQSFKSKTKCEIHNANSKRNLKFKIKLSIPN